MKTISLDQLQAAVGTEVGVSPWRVVSQTMIDQFADATDDHQFIHVDPERAARETPFGGTIAHGFLLLSLLSAMTFETLAPLEGSVTIDIENSLKPALTARWLTLTHVEPREAHA